LIFTNSDFTKSEIERVAARAGWPVPPLVNVGIGFDSLSEPGTSRDNEILVLASPFRHKRTELAVIFLKRWQEQTKFDGTVRWVGNFPAGLSLPQFAGWSHASRLPDLEYRQAVSRASVLVFFSEYEGFGMPPVEAIVQGACPVYSELPATQEILAGKGCPFHNDDYESFLQAMKKALRISPNQIEAWREELLNRFNWNRVCTRVVEALKLRY
jgi:glycosyltransferase involved in cell wall biosynthesis